MKNLTGQKLKVFNALQSGDWVSGTFFLRELYLSQYHARIFELQELGYDIEASDFKDSNGFKSYRLLAKEPTQSTLL